MSIETIAERVLGDIRRRGTYRTMRRFEGPQGPRMRVDGRDVLAFAGSNYLDLASHPAVVQAAQEAATANGCAAAGSRLINGNLDVHEELEEDIADFFGLESALVFATGYMANVGVIPALVGRGDLLISDALNHASIVDGARLAKSEVAVFPHGDIDGLERILKKESSRPGEILVAVDGVYSMDGDVAPLAEILPLCRRYGAISLVDDAHGTGTLGPRGRGSADQQDVLADVDILMGTLGKSVGSFGAFVAGRRPLRDLLVNTARSFIFSCALAPPAAAAARAAFEIMEAEPERRVCLQANALRLREGLARHGISTDPSSTHIVPVIVGENAKAMAVCEGLLKNGFHAQGIRHPSVPEGTARLRLTPMSSHTESEIDALVEALALSLPGEARAAAG
ncbi:MAG: 8-amino-7-oxononanoate synthase [Myxococcota bacterium]|nr:8-amino-7-oxononanoate synthase [Myxococcota bacterium]